MQHSNNLMNKFTADTVTPEDTCTGNVDRHNLTDIYIPQPPRGHNTAVLPTTVQSVLPVYFTMFNRQKRVLRILRCNAESSILIYLHVLPCRVNYAHEDCIFFFFPEPSNNYVHAYGSRVYILNQMKLNIFSMRSYMSFVSVVAT